MNGWNSKNLASISGNFSGPNVHECAKNPAVDMVKIAEVRQHHWLGQILWLPPERMIKQEVLR